MERFSRYNQNVLYKTVVVFLSLFFTAAPVFGSEVEDDADLLFLLKESSTALDKKEYETMLHLHETSLGILYESGSATDSDPVKAKALYQEAAENGASVAQYRLGRIYENRYNDDKALEWYKKSANNGFSKAQYKVGLFYEMKRAGTNNDSRAKDNYEKAVKQDHAEAMLRLGGLYEVGRTGTRNRTTAYELFKDSDKHGSACGAYRMGLLHIEGVKDRNGVEGPDGVKYSVLKGETIAVELIKKSASDKCSDANYQMFLFYTSDEELHISIDGVQTNVVDAIEQLKIAADLKLAKAQKKLAWYYIKGFPDKKDLKKLLDKSYSNAARFYYLAGLSFLRDGDEDEANECLDELKSNIGESWRFEKYFKKLKEKMDERST